jgi:thiol-disulfide isomerase/thioredoxin
MALLSKIPAINRRKQRKTMKHYFRELLKIAFIYLFLLFSTGIEAQSIDFIRGKNWNEIVNQAKEEKKLIFIDFFTDWCGPCKLMDENVFPVNEVKTFYNTHFINAKIDAEKGEGVDLKSRFEVKVYPTYVFVDPNTEQIVHRSTSRQDVETFIFTGQSALNPDTRSCAMEKRYVAGDRNPLLLKNYAAYLSSCYQSEKLDTLVNQYLSVSEAGLKDSLAWHFFTRYQKGCESVPFDYLLQNKEALTPLYGKEAVDKKIGDAFFFDLNRLLMNGIYNADRFDQAQFESLYKKVDAILFAGKEFLLKKVDVLDYFRQKKYAEAADIADQFPSDESVPMQEIFDFYGQLVFLSRNNEEKEWILRALTYARFIAYNDVENRSKAEIHYNYASMLEKALRLSASDASVFQTPVYGEKEYTLRSGKLKPKPSK